MFNSSIGFALAAHELIFTAQKLRHALLFRECFIHVVGNWGRKSQSPDGLRIKEDPDIGPLVSSSYIQLCQLVMRVDKEIMLAMIQKDDNLSGILSHVAPSIIIGKFGTDDPIFYRAIKNVIDGRAMPYHFGDLNDDLDKLLKNRLFFDKSRYNAGKVYAFHISRLFY